MHRSIWFGFLFYYNWTPFLSNLLPSDGCVKRFLMYEISGENEKIFLCGVIQRDHDHRMKIDHRSFTDPSKKCRQMGRPGGMLQQESLTTLGGDTPNHLPSLGMESGINRFWSLHTWFLQPAAKVEQQSWMKIQSHCCEAWGTYSCPSSKENFLFDFNSMMSYWVLLPSHCYLTLKLLPEKLSNSEYLETSTSKNFHFHLLEEKGTFKMIVSSLLPFKFRITKRLK